MLINRKVLLVQVHAYYVVSWLRQTLLSFKVSYFRIGSFVANYSYFTKTKCDNSVSFLNLGHFLNIV